MLDKLSRFWEWLKFIGKKLWKNFMREVDEKKANIKSMTIREGGEIIKDSAKCFFGSAAKTYCESWLRKSSHSRAANATGFLSMPYEHCFDAGKPRLLSILAELSKSICSRVWNGYRIKPDLISIDFGRVNDYITKEIAY